MKKKIYLLSASAILLGSCQSSATKEAVKHQQLAEEAIAIHDEIMPQIAHFDKTTVKIDSILENLGQVLTKDPQADTAAVRIDLITLKSNLEAATDNMMTWMKEYNPDSTTVSYQEGEIEKIKAMRKQFEDVSLESNKKLGKL
ncbi:transposase [Sphingobacterium faecale]|uniref:Transposase n=1 Tax=Sphingobacterium faecale TaxID=2803775 RepID=A0ABS1QYY5_9SPHI|nr:transposase [Sphingobacterium faecale]MBL1407290.1 transposase [Sphingobacterium faecale]